MTAEPQRREPNASALPGSSTARLGSGATSPLRALLVIGKTLTLVPDRVVADYLWTTCLLAPPESARRQVVGAVGGDPRLSATLLQTVGGKGYDGFILAVVGDRR